MNAVPLTPAELKERNERAHAIVANCTSSKQRQVAELRLKKDAVKHGL